MKAKASSKSEENITEVNMEDDNVENGECESVLAMVSCVERGELDIKVHIPSIARNNVNKYVHENTRQ